MFGVSIACQILVISSSVFFLCCFKFELLVESVQICALCFSMVLSLSNIIISSPTSVTVYNDTCCYPIFYCDIFKVLQVYLCCESRN